MKTVNIPEMSLGIDNKNIFTKMKLKVKVMDAKRASNIEVLQSQVTIVKFTQLVHCYGNGNRTNKVEINVPSRYQKSDEGKCKTFRWLLDNGGCSNLKERHRDLLSKRHEGVRKRICWDRWIRRHGVVSREWRKLSLENNSVFLLLVLPCINIRTIIQNLETVKRKLGSRNQVKT
ncbi:5921_t:CDS:2, partial [Dentiscutata heterogama]